MPGSVRALKYWIPALLWMAVIFSASTDAMSARRTSRIIGPFLRWINPGVSEETIYRVQYAVRKSAHMTEYAILSVLLWVGLRRPASGPRRPWSWPQAALAASLAALYALTDEFHQTFVPSRLGQWRDVLFDTAGAVLGLVALYALGRWRRRW